MMKRPSSMASLKINQSSSNIDDTPEESSKIINSSLNIPVNPIKTSRDTYGQ